MSKDYLVLSCPDNFGLVFKIYSSDFMTFYGDFYSEREVYNKITALRQNKLNEVSV